MTENAKIQAEVALNADPAVQGFKKLEAAGAAASKSIEESGKKAEKALANVGTAAEESAKKQQSVDSRIEASLKRRIALTEAAVKGERALDEARISNRGADPQRFSGLLDELDRARQKNDAYVKSLVVGNSALNSYGQTARQTAAALRTVPAQFTDIITSLQGGQAPLTVLLQQGGQLKDVFGGAGNAARALGGYILGLVNPFTVAAAAGAGFMFAFEKGAAEQREFQKTLILTGNAAGVTAGQLADISARIDQFSGATQGKAAEALNIFANAGIKGADSLQRFTASAIEFERAGGDAVETVAKNFANLAKDPLKASLALNESTNFLTRSLYEQIKALEDQGKATEAAKLAQEAYNAALSDRTPQLLQNLGLIERGWIAIKDATKGAFDAALSIGRGETLQQQAESLRAQIEQRQGRNASVGIRDGRATEELKQQLYAINERIKLEGKSALLESERSAALKVGVQADELRSKYLGDQLAKTKELAAVQESFRKGGISASERDDFSAAINKKYEPKTPKGASSSAGDSELTNLKARTQQEQIYLDLLKERGLAADKLNEGEKAAVRLQEELKGALSGRARSIKEAALEQAKLLGQTINQAEAEKDFLRRQEDAAKASSKAYDDLVASITKSTDSINAQIEKENEAAAAIGKTKDQIADLEAVKLSELAKSKDRLAVLAQDIDFSGALTEKYQKEAAALRLLAEAKKSRASAETANNKLVYDSKAGQKALDDFQSYINRLDTARIDGLFNGALKGIDKLILGTKTLADLNQKADKARQAAIEKYGKGSVEVIKIENQKLEGQLGLYTDIAGAAKGMFAEGSKGYQALAVAQSALAVATGITAIANQGLGDPYTAIPRMIAMAATLAQLGISVNGISGGSSAPVTNQGTGTVFGDPTGKSASIENSIELLADTSRLGLRYSAQMASSLKNIEAAFAGVTNLLLRNGQITKLESSIQTGVSDTGISKLLRPGAEALGPFGGILANLVTKLFGKKTTLQGSGILGGPQSFGDIQDIGFQGNYYADIQTKRKFFGITTSTTNSTILSALDAELARQFTQIFTNMGDSILSASQVFGLRTDSINAALESYIVDIGKVDLRGLTGEQIQEKLAAVFGAEFDKLAQSIIPGLESIQQVGEGYSETLVRAATQLESVNTTFTLLGGSLSLFTKSADVFLEKLNGGFRTAPGIDRAIVADQLVQQFGGLEEFNSATQSFYESFYSVGERTRQTLGLIGTSLEGLGLALPTSASAFRELTTSLDITTEAGRQAFETLVTLGPTFADLQNQLLESAGISSSAIADVLQEGLTGRISQEDLGKKLSDIVIDGFNNALASGVAEQISQSFTNQIIAPMLQAIATGGALSSAVSQSTIDNFVAEAEAQIRLYTEVITSPQVQSALTQLQTGLSGVTSAMGGLTAASNAAASAASEAARYTANGADIARANSPWIQAAEDAERAGRTAQEVWKGIGETISDEIKRIRGEIIGANQSSSLAQFTTLTAQARAGSQEAAKQLPGASQSFLSIAKENSSSLLEFRRQQAFIIGSLEETNSMLGLNGSTDAPLPSSPVSTFLSQNGVGQQSSAQLLQEIQAMRGELAGMRTSIDSTAQNTKITATVLEDSSSGRRALLTEVDA
jgi:phage-related minor tail protein